MSTEELLQSDVADSKRKRLMAIFAVIAVAVLILGLTLSWFVGSQTASTVGKVAQPSKLHILGPNQSAIEQLDLSYDASNIDGDKKVTVRRGFCVDSEKEGFELQVANTTNISNLEIKVYRVMVNDPSASGDVVEPGSYSWSKYGDPISLTSIDDPSGTQTFGGYTNVQGNAIPQYRYHVFAKDELDKDGSDVAEVTNFIIEATWTESVKETDMVYLIARSSATAESN